MAQKTTEHYGVQLTSFQSLLLNCYLMDNNIGMNSKTPEKRTAIVKEWLANLKEE